MNTTTINSHCTTTRNWAISASAIAAASIALIITTPGSKLGPMLALVAGCLALAQVFRTGSSRSSEMPLEASLKETPRQLGQTAESGGEAQAPTALVSPCSIPSSQTIRLLDGPLTHFWEYEVNNFGGGNWERQMYVDDPRCARIEDGELVITAIREEVNICGHVMPFASGRIRTKRRFDFRYGTISFEAKLPETQGLWPAVWMLPTDDAYGPWPRSGEIDILEAKNAEAQIYHAVHFGESFEKHQMKHTIIPNPNPSGWVKFRLEWQEGRLTWFINNGQTFEVELDRPFDKPFHLIVNLAVGGQFPGCEPHACWNRSEFRVRNLEVVSRSAS